MVCDDRPRLEVVRQWWNERKDDYPFHITTKTNIKPHLIPGNHVSVVLREGYRIWGFKKYSEFMEFIKIAGIA